MAGIGKPIREGDADPLELPVPLRRPVRHNPQPEKTVVPEKVEETEPQRVPVPSQV